jgi:hypothetical protein
MLVPGRVVNALETKKDRFARFQVQVRESSNRYKQALEKLPSLSREEIERRLAEAGIEWPGARPTAEQDSLRDAVVSFGLRWPDHESARAWAMQALLYQTTFAADGSQIPPSRDFSVPVAAVQVGWFENPHAPAQSYTKDLMFEVLAPDELAAQRDDVEAQEGQPGGDFPDVMVNLRRFETECQVIVQYIQAHANAFPAPLCLFDGSLVVSFARHMSPEARQAYVNAITGMMRASEAARVPLVGYVDTSHARDLTMMLCHTFGLPLPAHLNDGILLRPRMQWGDRSLAYVCARDDNVLPLYGDEASRVCFIYLKTTADGAPARAEFPGWLLDDTAEFERVLNLIRAECVVGNGYPYAMETADAVAVITIEDRKRFYAVFQQFAEKEGLALRYSRKALSKATRR